MSEDGAASIEFVVVLAIAISLSLLVTVQVSVATGTMAQRTGDEIEGASPLQPAAAGGCAVTVAETGGKTIEDC